MTIKNKSKTPLDTALRAFRAETEASEVKPCEATLKAVSLAVHIAIAEERRRCHSICKDHLEEYRSYTKDSDKPDYADGYKDGAEDCMESMSKIDSMELAQSDAIIFSSVPKRKYADDVVAKFSFDSEDSEEVVWLE